jgi:superoxide reductase
MLPEHHIAWIGTFSDKSWDIKWLNPTDKPNVITLVEPNATVYEYCNLHGLWKK